MGFLRALMQPSFVLVDESGHGKVLTPVQMHPRDTFTLALLNP